MSEHQPRSKVNSQEPGTTLWERIMTNSRTLAMIGSFCVGLAPGRFPGLRPNAAGRDRRDRQIRKSAGQRPITLAPRDLCRPCCEQVQAPRHIEAAGKDRKRVVEGKRETSR